MRKIIILAAILITKCLTLCEAQTAQAPMVLEYDKPATFFEESLPIGNGKLGALNYGGTDDHLFVKNIR